MIIILAKLPKNIIEKLKSEIDKLAFISPFAFNNGLIQAKVKDNIPTNLLKTTTIKLKIIAKGYNSRFEINKFNVVAIECFLNEPLARKNVKKIELKTKKYMKNYSNLSFSKSFLSKKFLK